MKNEPLSDSELSIDSLEDFSVCKSKNNLQESSGCYAISNSTSSGKVLPLKEHFFRRTNNNSNNNIHQVENKSQVLSSSRADSFLNSEESDNINIKETKTKNDSFSYFFNNTSAPRSQSARLPSIQRISRRHQCLGTPVSQRTRQRSVSYLEQFRRKLGETSSVVSTTLSTLSSDLSKVTSLSGISGETNETNTATSEFEFDEDIVSSESNSVPNTAPTERIQLITTIIRKEGSKQRKENSDILNKPARQTNRGGKTYDQDAFDKRKAIEKREEYSKKVHLRNQMQVNQQKEREKAHKFKETSFKDSCYPCDLECYTRIPRERSKLTGSRIMNKVPLSLNQQELSTKAATFQPRTQKAITKTADKKITKKPLLGNKDVNHLEMLQKRHENEKHVVESIRKKFVKR